MNILYRDMIGNGCTIALHGDFPAVSHIAIAKLERLQVIGKSVRLASTGLIPATYGRGIYSIIIRQCGIDNERTCEIVNRSREYSILRLTVIVDIMGLRDVDCRRNQFHVGIYHFHVIDIPTSTHIGT